MIICRAAVLRRLTDDTGIILLVSICLAASLHGPKATGWLDEEPRPAPVRYATSPVLVYGTASGPVEPAWLSHGVWPQRPSW